MKSWRASSRRRPGAATLFLLGTAYQGVGLALLGFALLAWALGESPRGFALGGALGLFLGGLAHRAARPQAEPPRTEVFLSVALLWLLVPTLGAVPFWLSGGMNYLDALFEAVSGFTTTGATVLKDFGQFGPTLFLWRALIQWVGGMGIVVLFLVVLPHLAVAGRGAFFAESTGIEKEKITPRLRHTAQAVFRVYVLLTLLAVLAYALAGMPLFEAVANALTTLPAGGFSPNPMSFATYTPLAQWLGTLFMFLAGVNFLLQYRLIFGREVRPLLLDGEFRAYAGVVLASGLSLFLYLYTHHAYGLEESLRHAFFQVVSILTTTGFASVDFAQWVVPAQALLVVLMFIGGSAGSGAGGIKVVRWLVLFGLLRRELARALHPQAVLPLRLGGRVVGEEVLRQVSVFVLLYTLSFALGALALALLERDFVVAFTASAQAIGNIGPGLGAVGPMGSYAELHPLSKLVLIFQMWAGRIELIPVFLLLVPEFWRRLK
ncbi:TrkH family potassium uptake protein [Thermus filiformis]|uniref:Potassium transporter TrkG n=1 Tax=Thermus filiformis TaxID=276 RepID=A0A0A2XBM9_THEFI|nr:TrkH family potassium uptake protein [Thermus filiformis]KGQ22564.1 potassium transporter TrkG [Thermus filiformis]